MGGALDHTNIITPAVSVITCVGLDHMSSLGNTKEKIAKAKAGIIKQGVPVVVGFDMPLDVVKEVAREKNAPIYVIHPDSENYTYDELNSKVAR